MPFRIQRSTKADAIVFALSGEIDDEHNKLLQALLDAETDSRILLDLQHVTFVGRAGVEFLAQVEAAGVRIAHCPGYVRRWITAERRGTRGRHDPVRRAD